MDTTKIAEMLDNSESHRKVIKRILSGQDLKSEINQYVVVDPHFESKFHKWERGFKWFPTWDFKEDMKGIYVSKSHQKYFCEP